MDSAGPPPSGPLLASPKNQSRMTVRTPCVDASKLRPLLNAERMADTLQRDKGTRL